MRGIGGARGLISRKLLAAADAQIAHSDLAALRRGAQRIEDGQSAAGDRKVGSNDRVAGGKVPQIQLCIAARFRDSRQQCAQRRVAGGHDDFTGAGGTEWACLARLQLKLYVVGESDSAAVCAWIGVGLL